MLLGLSDILADSIQHSKGSEAEVHPLTKLRMLFFCNTHGLDGLDYRIKDIADSSRTIEDREQKFQLTRSQGFVLLIIMHLCRSVGSLTTVLDCLICAIGMSKLETSEDLGDLDRFSFSCSNSKQFVEARGSRNAFWGYRASLWYSQMLLWNISGGQCFQVCSARASWTRRFFCTQMSNSKGAPFRYLVLEHCWRLIQAQLNSHYIS